MKSGGLHNTIFPEPNTLSQAKSLYTAMKKDKKIYFVVLSKAIEMNHP
jgi:hypothetical protein